VAVYERAYRGYSGAYTPEWSRFIVLPRYGLEGIFASRFFLAFFVACFIPVLALLIMIYLSHNAKVLQLLGATPADMTLIDAPLFMAFLAFEGKFLGFLLALIVGPALISPDMLNNALPLYLSRPFNRTEYILGKLSVLVLLLSAITWVPYLLLFALQGYMSGWEWTRERLYIPVAIFVGSWAWILSVSLISLAVAAVFKRKLWARVFLFVTLSALGAFGAILAEGLGLWFGHNLNVFQMNVVIWGELFRTPVKPAPPLWSAWATLILACAISLRILYRKVRAYEVVR
jgi:hypothetical protein